ncbi:hypothetical protein STANM309S_02755 [Streptomyces tanashiensis]
MPLEGGPLQEPHGQGDRAAGVAGAARGAEQRPCEPVGLLGPDPGHREQLPGVLAEHRGRALAERGGDLLGQRFRGPALGEDLADGGRGAGRRGRGPLRCGGPHGHRRGGLGGGAAGRRLGCLGEDVLPGASEPPSTARTAASRSAAVPLSLAPAS